MSNDRGNNSNRPSAPDPIDISHINLGGRPTKYKAEFCQKVLELGAEGECFTTIANRLGVARSTIYEWVDAHPEFSDAMTRARDLSMEWWQQAGREGMYYGKTFGDRIWEFNMKNRFPEDWKDRTETDLTSGGKPIKFTFTSPDDENL